MSAYSDNLPRERYVRDYRDADIHASPLEHPDAVRYERVVRREYVGGSPLGSLFKWLIPALLVGVLVSGLMPSHDIHERGLISSWTDRVSDSISNIGDKIFHRHQPTMMDKARLAAWEAKKAVEDSTYGVADKVTDSVSYLGDKISDTADEALSTVRNKFSGSGRPVKNAKKRVYDLGYEAQDKLYDVKDRAYDLSREAQNKLYKAKKNAYKLGRDAQGKLYNAKNRVADSFDDHDDYYDEYVRQPARRMRRQYNRGDWSDVVPDRVKDFAERNYPRSYRTKSSSNWSLFHMIRQHPILSTLLGVLLFLSLRPFFNSSSYDSDSNEMGSTKRKALSGLALVLDRLGAFLGNMGDQVQNSENFSDMRRRPAQSQNYREREYERPMHSDNININRAHVAAASSSSSLSSDIPHNSLSSSLAANHGPSTTTTTVPVVKQTEFTKTKVDQMKSNMDSVQKAEGGQTPVLGGR